MSVLVEKWKDEIVFLYKVAAGVCSRSYGIEVAQLAGVPREVLTRAREIQGQLESQSQRTSRARSAALNTHHEQLGFFDDRILPEMSHPLGGDGGEKKAVDKNFDQNLNGSNC